MKLQDEDLQDTDDFDPSEARDLLEALVKRMVTVELEDFELVNMTFKSPRNVILELS